MTHAALICTVLLTALAGEASPSPRDLKTYDALKLKAGKDATAQVKLALGARRRGWTPSGSSTWRRRYWPTPATRPRAGCSA